MYYVMRCLSYDRRKRKCVRGLPVAKYKTRAEATRKAHRLADKEQTLYVVVKL